MKRFLAATSLFSLLLVLPGQAQQASVPPLDVVGYVKSGYGATTTTFYQGELTLSDGAKTQLYLPATQLGFAKELYCFFEPPTRQSRAKAQTINVADVKSMTVNGQYFETMKADSLAPEVLALRLAAGAVELFTYAQSRTIPLLVPIPGASLGGGINTMIVPSPTYINNHWYVRRNGSLQKVRRSNFAAQMSEYLADYPELATKIHDGHKDCHYQDMPAIIAAYNVHQASLGQLK